MIVVDVETSGLSPKRHGIVSIGAVEFEQANNQFDGECRIDKDAEVDPEALKVNGFSEEQIRDKSKPSAAELIGKFLVWAEQVADKTLGGHNTAFDIGFLRAACRLGKIQNWPFGYRYVDMHSIAYGQMKRHRDQVPLKYDVSAVYSNAVYDFVGLPPEPSPHQALTGAKMEAEAMQRLIYGRTLLKEFAKYPVPDYLIA
ncbi:3'-5' exonuclease [Candidatus Microgenomates bacterium]|nr:3'-5' exonuclease [Candidatus Microgenomates bacterium]